VRVAADGQNLAFGQPDAAREPVKIAAAPGS